MAKLQKALLLAGSALISFVGPAVAQVEFCGTVPTIPDKIQDVSSVKADAQAKADGLFKYALSPDLKAQIDITRNIIYQDANTSRAIFIDRYMYYLFCVIVMNDKKFTTQQRLDALKEWRSGPDGHSIAPGQQKLELQAKPDQEKSNKVSTDQSLQIDSKIVDDFVIASERMLTLAEAGKEIDQLTTADSRYIYFTSQQEFDRNASNWRDIITRAKLHSGDPDLADRMFKFYLELNNHIDRFRESPASSGHFYEMGRPLSAAPDLRPSLRQIDGIKDGLPAALSAYARRIAARVGIP